MSEMGDRSSQQYSESIEDVDCPLCGKAKVRVTFVAGYMSWNISSIAAGSKRTPYFHDPRIRVGSSCPACKATKAEIKEALEKGKSGVDWLVKEWDPEPLAVESVSITLLDNESTQEFGGRR